MSIKIIKVKTSSRQPLGFALMEVLVSFVMLAFGMLGIASLLITSQKANSSSYAKQQAIQSLNNITDRIRSNSASAITGGYDINNLAAGAIPATPSVDCGTATCTAAQLSAYDTWYWLARDLSSLPAGRGSVVSAVTASGTNTLVTVIVQWNDAPAQKKLGGSTSSTGATADLSQISIQTML